MEERFYWKKWWDNWRQNSYGELSEIIEILLSLDLWTWLMYTIESISKSLVRTMILQDKDWNILKVQCCPTKYFQIANQAVMW